MSDPEFGSVLIPPWFLGASACLHFFLSCVLDQNLELISLDEEPSVNFPAVTIIEFFLSFLLRTLLLNIFPVNGGLIFLHSVPLYYLVCILRSSLKLIPLDRLLFGICLCLPLVDVGLHVPFSGPGVNN
jgi:hypothetical protein